jgi:hypothetical protein
MSKRAIGASFRDPSGFIFKHEGRAYRQVNQRYREDYDLLMSSGLFEALVAKNLLVGHEEVDPPAPTSPDHYRTLLPEQIPFISYPYEWCFSQLKDAALLTLRLQQIAMKHEMSLKDATSYNIQFLNGRPIMIDTLSFERYREGSPWVGYRQFCQHFLAPLSLMCKRDLRLLAMMRVHLDGIPLDLATSLLPTRSFLNRGLYMHLRLHARFQRSYEGAASAKADEEAKAPKARPLSKRGVSNLVEDLRGVVRKLDWAPKGTEWADYYLGDSYEDDSLEHKQTLVRDQLKELAPSCVWDLGANTGVYSRIAAECCDRVVSFDIDPACVERNYREAKKTKETRVLPQLLDLVNPSPALGWAHDERSSLAQRAQADVILALALIHHIAISNNVPLPNVAAYLAELASNLIIEFVPKSDPKVKTLLATREDVFPAYTREGFEAAFQEYFEIVTATDIRGSDRTLYQMRRRS